MDTRRTIGRALAGRDVAIAYGVVVALYVVRYAGFQPVQIPAYLLIVAYDVVESALPVLTPYHPVGFPVFLYVVAVAGAGLARQVRPDEGGAAGWRTAVGGVCLVVGAVSLAFGAFVGGPIVAPADNPTPLAITGATGLIFLGAGWWVLGRPWARSTDLG